MLTNRRVKQAALPDIVGIFQRRILKRKVNHAATTAGLVRIRESRAVSNSLKPSTLYVYSTKPFHDTDAQINASIY